MTPDTEVQFYRKVSDLNLKTNSEDLFWRAVLFLVFENVSVAVGQTAGSEGLTLKTRAYPGEKSCLPAATLGHLQCLFKPTPIQT